MFGRVIKNSPGWWFVCRKILALRLEFNLDVSFTASRENYPVVSLPFSSFSSSVAVCFLFLLCSGSCIKYICSLALFPSLASVQS